MAVTDQEILSWIQALMIEPRNGGASWASGLWTVDEVITYANEAQDEFLKETGLILTPATQALPAGVPRVALPVDLITLDSVAFDDFQGSIRNVPRADGYQADAAFTSPGQSWETNPLPDRRPLAYTIGETPNLQLQVMPPSGVGGLLHYLYVALGTALTGAGVSFSVPADFTCVIQWRIITKMLSKIGRGAADERAQYAESWWRMGVAATKVMLQGWV